MVGLCRAAEMTVANSQTFSVMIRLQAEAVTLANVPVPAGDVRTFPMPARVDAVTVANVSTGEVVASDVSLPSGDVLLSCGATVEAQTVTSYGTQELIFGALLSWLCIWCVRTGWKDAQA